VDAKLSTRREHLRLCSTATGSILAWKSSRLLQLWTARLKHTILWALATHNGRSHQPQSQVPRDNVALRVEQHGPEMRSADGYATPHTLGIFSGGVAPALRSPSAHQILFLCNVCADVSDRMRCGSYVSLHLFQTRPCWPTNKTIRRLIFSAVRNYHWASAGTRDHALKPHQRFSTSETGNYKRPRGVFSQLPQTKLRSSSSRFENCEWPEMSRSRACVFLFCSGL